MVRNTVPIVKKVIIMDRMTLASECIKIIDKDFYFMDIISRKKWENSKHKLLYEVEMAKSDYLALNTLETYLAKLNDPHTKLIFREENNYILPFNFLFIKRKLYLEWNNELKEVYSINGYLVNFFLKKYEKIYKEYPLVLLESAIIKDIQVMKGDFCGISLEAVLHDSDSEKIILQPLPFKEWLDSITMKMNNHPINIVYIKRINADCISIQITTFRDKDLMSKILEEFSHIKGEYNTIIFDVRNNTGGYIETTKAVVSSIISEQIQLDYKIARKDQEKITYDSVIIKANQSKQFQNKSIIVFVNYRTMSSSEYVFTKAIQQNGGLVVGEKTAGLRDQATVVPISESVTLQVTTKRYVRKGEYLKEGITPDVYIEEKINDYKNDSYYNWFFQLIREDGDSHKI